MCIPIRRGTWSWNFTRTKSDRFTHTSRSARWMYCVLCGLAVQHRPFYCWKSKPEEGRRRRNVFVRCSLSTRRQTICCYASSDARTLFISVKNNRQAFLLLPLRGRFASRVQIAVRIPKVYPSPIEGRMIFYTRDIIIITGFVSQQPPFSSYIYVCNRVTAWKSSTINQRSMTKRRGDTSPRRSAGRRRVAIIGLLLLWRRYNKYATLL